MTALTISKSTVIQEQKLILPGYYDWQQFKALQSLIDQQPGVKFSYLDGVIALMTLGETHEMIKTLIGFLIELYLFHQEIDFIAVGSATRESEEKSVSFEPDESYYIGEKKEHPDLAIEVNITSGSIKKLQKYQRFQIKEVWFCENNQFSIYYLQDGEYEQISQSQLLPNLDIKLLETCILIPSRLEAIKTFTKQLKIDN
jgi:Uma2 family endonuclease